jgi:hypothetical protein
MTGSKAINQGKRFEDLRRRQEAAEERHRRLIALGRQWDHTVRSELRQLAHALWANGHAPGLVLVGRYRLRHQLEAEPWVWWIERDVPPYDRYRCEAYRVTLVLDGRNEPVLEVQSGAGVYQVAPLTVAALDTSLAEAGQDPPLLIPRAMGEVKD